MNKATKWVEGVRWFESPRSWGVPTDPIVLEGYIARSASRTATCPYALGIDDDVDYIQSWERDRAFHLEEEQRFRSYIFEEED